MLTLDVGCGQRKMGDINVDINRNCHPDVVCDIHFLPFRNGQFTTTYCYHVLEHKGVHPQKAVKELMRVSEEVEIQVPHWLSRNAKKNKNHANFHIMKRSFWLSFQPLITKTVELDHVRFIRFIPFLLRPNNITIRLVDIH